MSWGAADAPGLSLADGASVGEDVTFGANVTVHPGTGGRQGLA